MEIEKLVLGNQRFLKLFQKEQKLYEQLANHGQYPKVLWVGCSDSRVVPEFIVDAKAGDLFIARNIANIVPPESAHDLAMSSILEYTVLHLHIEHIVICGHTCCRGITSMIKDDADGSNILQWLEYARPAISDHKNEETAIEETIKNNILLQAQNLQTYTFISERIENLTIHRWLYDIHTGSLSCYDETQKCWIPFIHEA